MVNRPIADIPSARPGRHLQRVERKISPQVAGDLPANNSAGNNSVTKAV
jgi:hypothetical protein